MKSSQPTRFRLARFALYLCGVLGTLSAGAMAQSYVFNAATFATGHNPRAIANADFNGDGRLDLAVANFDDSTVSVFLGNPIGTYPAHVDYATGPNPTALLIADFNNDTKIDLAAVNNNCPVTPCPGVGSVSLLLGNGDGTFQNHLVTNVGNSPSAELAADFNLDSKLDLVVTNSQDNTMQVLLGRGDGTFSIRLPRPTGTNPRGIAAGDYTADGFLDLAVANAGEADVSLFRGTGTGNFLAQLLFPAGPNPVAIVSTDFNGDGHPDVATANSGSATISVLFGKDPRGFQAPQNFAVAGLASGISLGDFNADGRLDIAVTSANTDTVSILGNNGDSTFQSHVDSAVGSDPFGLTTGDLTGDGKVDLAIVNNVDNNITILPGEGNGAFQSRFGTNVGRTPSGVATGDFNTDTKMDVAVANRSDNNILVLLGNGDGTFTAAAGSPPQTGARPSAVIAIELNDDSKLDLVATNSVDNTVSVLLGNGDGTFQTASSFAVGRRPTALLASDFDNDSKLDLAVCNQTDNTVSFLKGNGNGTFLPQRTFFTGAGSSPVALSLGDFGNGKPDLAVAASGTGKAVVLLGDGNGNFSPPASYTAGTTPSGIAVKDFNGDSMLDLAVSNSGGNNVSILLGNGNGTFQAPVDYATAKTPFSVAVDDFNADGKWDLAVGASSTTSSRVSILLGNGDGTYQFHVDHGTKVLQQNLGEPLAITDFNGDGSPDLVVADQLANSISVFLNTPLPVGFPMALSFGLMDIGVPSPPKTATLTNSGSAPLDNLVVSASGDYAQSTACGVGLAVAESCSTDVTFTPTNGGTRTGSLTYTDTAPAGPQNVALTGVGNAPAVTLSVPNLTFGVTVVGQSSSKQQVTLTNVGAQPLLISSIAVSGDFLQTNTCGSQVDAGANCVISISFKPRNSGTRTGTLTITDNALDSPQTVSLTGTGTIVKLVPTSLSFGNQGVGTTSNAQTVTLSNVGNHVININSISITGTNPGDFAIQNTTCGSQVNVGSNCTISVTFTPLQTGARKATLSFDDDGGGSPQSVALSGNGV